MLNSASSRQSFLELVYCAWLRKRYSVILYKSGYKCEILANATLFLLDTAS